MTENRIAGRFAYEWQDVDGNWFRSFGNENWQFARNGRMCQRHASINDQQIAPKDRLFHWPLGPDEAAFLSERDGFFQANISKTGWPYVQFRGGRPGFSKPSMSTRLHTPICVGTASISAPEI